MTCSRSKPISTIFWIVDCSASPVRKSPNARCSVGWTGAACAGVIMGALGGSGAAAAAAGAGAGAAVGVSAAAEAATAGGAVLATGVALVEAAADGVGLG